MCRANDGMRHLSSARLLLNLEERKSWLSYFTFNFLPARMFEPLILLSRRSLLTLVPYFSAISERVCPLFIVTLLPRERLERRELLRRELE